MNRRQEITLFLIVAALVVTWLFPYWISPNVGTPDTYQFLFTEHRADLKIDLGRLLLTDLIIVALGTSFLYALRSKS